MEFISFMHCSGDFDVVLKGEACRHEISDQVLKQCELFHICPSVYLIAPSSTLDISKFLSEQVKKLFIFRGLENPVCRGEILRCSKLTHLYFMKSHSSPDCCISHGLLRSLHHSVQKGNLPCLTHLSFESGRLKFHRSLHVLVQSTMPTLTYLNMSGCFLQCHECHFTTSASKLQTLLISARDETGELGIKRWFKKSCLHLRSLFLDNIAKEVKGELLSLLQEGIFSELKELGLSSCEIGSSVLTLRTISQFIPKLESLILSNVLISPQDLSHSLLYSTLCKLDVRKNTAVSGRLPILLSHKCISLQTLILMDCGLVPEDLRSLAHLEGRVPVLRHLNISINPLCAGQLECLFDRSCRWKDLHSINVKQPHTDASSQDSEIIMSKMAAGCLSSLEELGLSVYLPKYFTQMTSIPWLHLKKISILVFDPSSLNDNFRDNTVLQPLHDMIVSNLLPAFQSVSLVVPVSPRYVVSAAGKYFFLKRNIRLRISGYSDFTDRISNV